MAALVLFGKLVRCHGLRITRKWRVRRQDLCKTRKACHSGNIPHYTNGGDMIRAVSPPGNEPEIEYGAPSGRKPAGGPA
jgi:hypothetical protein